MVVVADKILRIVGPTGKPATTAALNKLVLRENQLEAQLAEVKSARGTDEAAQQQEIRKLEEALKEVRKTMESLKAQLEELRAQEEKEGNVRSAAREALSKAGNPYAPLFKADLTSLSKD
ncbi:hypothetical protein [Aquabacter cavernae]|uniref:hypothetical protein n=1 Tax=Aquabacter cavernae TaxID=2496029 RepID=UPI000F8CCFCC|nr:hypothetical protein [Aquabacter cavernae]